MREQVVNNQAMLENYARFGTLAALSPVGIFRTDAQGACVYVNERWTEITGLTPHEAMGHGWAAALHPQDREPVFVAWQQAARDNKRFCLEYRFINHDGEERWVFGQAAAEKSTSGDVIGYIGSIMDISVRKNQEEALAFLASASSASSEAFLQNCVRSLSKAFGAKYAFVGILEQPDENSVHTLAVCKNGDIVDNFSYDIANTPCEGVLTKAKQLISEGAMAAFPRDELLQQMGMDAYFGASLLSVNGRNLGLVVVAHTEPLRVDHWSDLLLEVYASRISTELEYQDAEDKVLRLGRILEQSLNEIYAFDAVTLRFVQVSQGARQNLGYTVEEMETMTPLDLKPEYTLERFQEMIQPLRDDIKHVVNFETLHKRKDGSTYPVEVRLQLSAEESHPAFIAVIQDVTDRRTAERELQLHREHLEDLVKQRTAQLEISLKEKEVLLKEIHHRVKNNLAMVSAFIQLQMGQANSSTARSALAACDRRVSTMALAHKKLYQSINHSSIDMHNFLQDLCDTMCSPVERGNISVNVKTNGIHLDADIAIPCAMIINEMLCNTLKYAFSDDDVGKIDIIITQANEGNYLLTYADNGCGLPEGANIDEFQTLGLQLVKIFVQQLSGELSVDRQEGTKYSIIIPRLG